MHVTGTDFDLSKGNDIHKHLLFFNELYGLSLKNNVLNVLGRTLDLILSDIPYLKVAEETHPLVVIDRYHPAMILELPHKTRESVCKQNNSYSYNFYKADFHSLYNELKNTDWNNLLHIPDLNIAVQRA